MKFITPNAKIDYSSIDKDYLDSILDELNIMLSELGVVDSFWIYEVYSSRECIYVYYYLDKYLCQDTDFGFDVQAITGKINEFFKTKDIKSIGGVA